MLVKVYYIVNENNSLNFKNFKIDDDGNDFITFEFIECDLEDGREKGGSIGKHKHKFKVEYKNVTKTFIIEKDESNENENIVIYTDIEFSKVDENEIQNLCYDLFSFFIKKLFEKLNEENFQQYFDYLTYLNKNYENLLSYIVNENNEILKNIIKKLDKTHIEKLCEHDNIEISALALEILSKFNHNLKETINEASEKFTKKTTYKNNHKHT